MTIDVIVQCIEEKFPPPQSHRSKPGTDPAQSLRCTSRPIPTVYIFIALAHRQVPTVFTLQGLIYLREKKVPVDPPGCFIAPHRLVAYPRFASGCFGKEVGAVA